jgi:NAD(P)-dependent dehydrogenase (short-subunit alcohol dehydrogenase family)
MKRFERRAAVVTGSSSGIGLAIAERLASEGAQLVLTAAPTDDEDLQRVLADFEERGWPAVGLAADVAQPETAERAVELALDRYGKIAVLINHAGFGYYEEFLDTPVEHLDRTLAVNVRGTFLMSLQAAEPMAHQGRGAIINTASTASFVGEEFQATYNASKGAVAALTRSLAVDLAPLGIRVNAVAPGWVQTRASIPIVENAQQWSKHRSRIPLDRPASPAEVAAVHAFLASEDASYVTGAVYMCDGGLTAGFRFSNWAAVEPPPEGFSIGIPKLPKTLGRRLGEE